jgi:DNA-directed RNA polymerase subunit M/transcription elongation factor TFIIS
MPKETGMYQCPSCSGVILFRNGSTRIFVCACGQVLNRLDSDDLVVKPAFTISQHNDLIRVGTAGVYKKKRFEVLGRFRLWLEESVYNYWTILFEDGAPAMLAEGYGMYAIMDRITLDKVVTAWDLGRLGPIDSLSVLGEADWYLKNKDKSWKYEVEGEVWMPECTDQFQLYDLYTTSDGHIEIIEYLPGFLAAYAVRYAEFSDLQLTSLNDQPPTPKEFTCTQCHTVLQIKTFPYAQSCSCSNCGQRYAFKGTDFRSQKKDKHNENLLSIPIGAKGTLKGIEYEVIGYALKEEDTAEAPQWKEYVLYNRAEGYAFLSEYAGSWLYVRERGNSPVKKRDTSDEIYYKGGAFDLYNRYQIRLVDTAGEFPYDIFDDRNIVSEEYIAPPYMWISEQSREDGICWFVGENQDRRALLKAFPYDLPEQTERGVLDPRGRMNLPMLMKITVGAILLMIVVHFLIGMTQRERQIYSGTLEMQDTVATMTYVTPRFTLDKWRSNLRFDLAGPVDNNWMDMEATLVNSKNGEEYHLEQTVEYYHGYDDGESWDEGSTSSTAYLGSVPSGTYELRMEVSRDTTTGWSTGPKTMSVVIKNDVPVHSNLLIFVGLLLVWPISSWLWFLFYDKKRWANSRFSPYNHS